MPRARGSTVLFALWAGGATVALALSAAARWRTPPLAGTPIAASTAPAAAGTTTASAQRERDDLSQWGLLGLISGRDPDARPGLDRLEQVDTVHQGKELIKIYEQRYRDVPVAGASVRVSEDVMTHEVVRVSGQYFATIDLDPKPRLTSEQAFSIWRKERPTLVDYELAESKLVIAPAKLWPAPHQGGRYFLVWHLRMKHGKKTDYPSYTAFVDAHTGYVVLSRSSAFP